MSDVLAALKHPREALIALATTLLVATSASAQSLFSPVLIVNDALVTEYELQQRVQFLTLLGAREDVRALAINQLTVEALQFSAARAAGFAPSQAAIEAAQAEFAARANLNRDQFVAALAQSGVDEATFRDFIGTGVAWRNYVQDRFQAEANAFPQAALDRAVETASLPGLRRVLMTEIILPGGDPASRAVSLDRARQLSQITDAEEFSRLARRFSLATSRLNGGELPWRSAERFPPVIAEAIASLRPGQTSAPVELDDVGIGVFHMRDAEDAPPTEPSFASVDYQLLQLPVGREADAQQIANQMARCDDVHIFASRFSETALQRRTSFLLSIPADIRTSLERLDRGESVVLNRGGAPAVLTLCARTFGEGVELDLEAIGLGVTNERLGILAAAHLNDLRARAIIQQPGG